MKAAVIIPVFNEGERVLPVIEAALGCEIAKEVIVVDDGSTDHTAALLSERSEEVTICAHAQNQGKGEALDTGMQTVRDRGYEAAVFLDGDLRGIKPTHVDVLLEPVLEQDILMTIGYLGLRKEFIKRSVFTKWGGLSGQRAIQTQVYDLLSDNDKRGFGIEAALNARLRQTHQHHRIARVPLEGVGHSGKRTKEPNLLAAARAYGKTYGAAVLAYARIELERPKIK